MTAIHETAYPRLKSSITERDLIEVYSPSTAERDLARKASKGHNARLGFLVLLKTFQRLGYFVMLDGVPKAIINHIAQQTGSETTNASILFKR